jgi:hypothetical protein
LTSVDVRGDADLRASTRLDGHWPAIQAVVDTNVVAWSYFGAVGAVTLMLAACFTFPVS